MRKGLIGLFLLLGLLGFSNGAIAQEDPRGKCTEFTQQFADRLKEVGLSPVFLAMDNNRIKFAILRSKTEWDLILFKYGEDGKITACLIDGGNDSVVLQEDNTPHPHTEGT
jgi:hypothetical protein